MAASTSSIKFNVQAYEEEEEHVEEEKPHQTNTEDIEIDDEEARVKDADKSIRDEEVLREMVLTSNGRDKVFVCSCQYVTWLADLPPLLQETDPVYH